MAWTDPNIIAGSTPIRKIHIDELRQAYKNVENSVTFIPPVSTSFTDSNITAGSTPIRKIHIDELRAAVNMLESKFSNNCNCNNCCQTQCGCQSCQSCQSCQKQCSACISCFPPGIPVLMGDMTWKLIELIKPGEYVIGIEGKPIKVLATPRVPLGKYRAMWKFPDNSLVFSGEHPFWIQKYGKQWWGVVDIVQDMRENRGETWIDEETRILVNYGRVDPPMWPIIGGEKFAYLDGWRIQYPELDKSRIYPDDFTLYTLITEGSHTMIANGYVCSAFALDTNPKEYDHHKTDWRGLKCLMER